MRSFPLEKAASIIIITDFEKKCKRSA